VDLSGLENLTSIQRLDLLDLPALSNVDALSAVTRIGELALGELPSLADLDGLGNVTAISSLHVSGAAIASLAPFASVTDLRYLHLEGLPSLTNLDGLSGLSPEQVVLADLPALSSISGLSSVQSMLDFELRATGVSDLSGLEQLELCDGRFVLDHNPALASLAALTNLTAATTIVVLDNPLLSHCEVESLLGRISFIESIVRGNDESGVCPPVTPRGAPLTPTDRAVLVAAVLAAELPDLAYSLAGG
jgi:hypothetical protein